MTVQTTLINPKQWICCMDCGLLIEPLKPNAKKWTICKLCAQVYTQTNHAWLEKMLAYHLSTLMQIPTRRLNKKYTVFICNQCGSYFIDLAQNKKIPKACKWCQIIFNRKAQKKQWSRCIICHTLITNNQDKQIVCETCVPALENIKKALKQACCITRIIRNTKSNEKEENHDRY